MRTLILVGMAAVAALAAQSAGAAELPVRGSAIGGVLGNVHSAANGQGQYRPALDYGTGYPADTRVYTGQPDRYPAEGDYRRVGAAGAPMGPGVSYSAPGYAEAGSYQGGYMPTGYGQYDANYGYDPREAAELARMCRRDRSSVAGGALGGVIGGVAGNRIAGRGNRRAGTLIGAGVGAIAGVAIGSAADRRRCETYWARQDAARPSYAPPAPGGYYPPAAYPPIAYPTAPYPHHGGTTVHSSGGFVGGHGWYTPGYVVTTVISNAAPVVTETVTTSVHYETVAVPVRARHAPKKRVVRPRPKPRCGC